MIRSLGRMTLFPSYRKKTSRARVFVGASSPRLRFFSIKSLLLAVGRNLTAHRAMQRLQAKAVAPVPQNAGVVAQQKRAGKPEIAQFQQRPHRGGQQGGAHASPR